MRAPAPPASMLCSYMACGARPTRVAACNRSSTRITTATGSGFVPQGSPTKNTARRSSAWTINESTVSYAVGDSPIRLPTLRPTRRR